MSYICNICNKNYKSYNSLWNHNKKFHKNNINNDNIKNNIKNNINNDNIKNNIKNNINNDNIKNNIKNNINNDNIKNNIKNNINNNDNINNNTNVIENIIKCVHCERLFNNRQNKWKHEKICKNNKPQSEHIYPSLVENEINNLKNQVESLKILVQKQCKIHPKTL
jgi:hypothetical protein